jgi:hypothetical protein
VAAVGYGTLPNRSGLGQLPSFSPDLSFSFSSSSCSSIRVIREDPRSLVQYPRDPRSFVPYPRS